MNPAHTLYLVCVYLNGLQTNNQAVNRLITDLVQEHSGNRLFCTKQSAAYMC